MASTRMRDNQRSRFYVLLCTFLLLLPASGSLMAAGTADRYTSVIDRLDDLQRTEHTVVIEIGRSKQGRPILAAAVFQPEERETDTMAKPRVLVISGQHGNERTPVEAALELLTTKNQKEQDFPENVVAVFVPIVNPDGFVRAGRENAVGMDLNRNWNARDQPETIAVANLIEQLRPDVLIDLHEWATHDAYSPNCVEIAGFGEEPHHRLSRILAHTVQIRTGESRLPLSPTCYSQGSDPRLAHRWYTEQGICSMLIETSPASSQEVRQAAYQQAIMAVLRALSDGRPAIAENISAVREARPGDSAWLQMLWTSKKTTPANSHIHFGLWLAMMTAAIYVAVRITCREQTCMSQVGLRRRKPARTRAVSMTEAVRFDLPVHVRVALLQTLRARPSDRS